MVDVTGGKFPFLGIQEARLSPYPVRQSSLKNNTSPGLVIHSLAALGKSPPLSLSGQWLRFHTPSAGGLGLIPGLGTRFCIPHLKILHSTAERSHILQGRLKILGITTKTQCSQINTFKKRKKKARATQDQVLKKNHGIGSTKARIHIHASESTAGGAENLHLRTGYLLGVCPLLFSSLYSLAFTVHI